MVKFSVVMPVHNEEEFLPYSLPSIYALNPDEVILLLDRCTDQSLNIALAISKRYPQISTILSGIESLDENWESQKAFLYYFGHEHCRNDFILNTDADIILDKGILKYIEQCRPNSLIVFERIDYPIKFRNLITRLLSHTPIGKMYMKISCIYLFNNKAWRKVRNEKLLPHLRLGWDTYLQKTLAESCEYKFILTKSLHLRPRETKQRDYNRGLQSWSIARRNFLVLLIGSMLFLRPITIVGYIHERWRK